MKVRRIAPRNEQRKKRVAAYCRVSTGNEDQADSIDAQRNYYEAYIKANPEWEFAGIYSDEQSGTSADKRAGFQQMVADAEAGKIDHVLVKSISRAFRNAVDAQDYCERLKAVGTTMYFEEDGINTGDSGSFMMFSLLAAVAQDQSRSIGENVGMAYKERFKRGEYNLGNNRILGYDTVDGKLVPNEDAWIPALVFRMFSEGATYGAIAEELEQRGAKRLRSDKPFTVSSIKGILENETYVGDKRLQKQAPQDYLTKKPMDVDYDSYYLKDDHEGVISRELWEQVQNMLEERKKSNKAGVRLGGDHHALFGRVFCAECGSIFRRRTYRNAHGQYKAWNCRERQKGKSGNGCMNKIWKEDELISAIVEELGWDEFDEGKLDGLEIRIDGEKIEVDEKLAKAV